MALGVRTSAFSLRGVLSQVLTLLLILQTYVPPTAARAASPVANGGAVPQTGTPAGKSSGVASSTQSFGVVLTEVATEFHDHAGLDHQEKAGKLVLSANAPTGQPHSFELVAADGAHAPFSNVGGLTGETRVATARDDGEGKSLAGIAPGELFAGTGAPGVIARVSADGSMVQNPWVTLPGEGSAVNGGLYVDRAGVFGGDLLAVTGEGRVWRVTAAGQPTLLASLGTPLRGVTTVPEDSERHGPWAGKVLVGAPAQGAVYSVDSQGNHEAFLLGLNPEDIRVVPAHENFYGLDTAGRKLWGAPDDAFTGMVGDVLVAQKAPGTLSRVRWDGDEFQPSQIAEVAGWGQITFSPAGVGAIAAARRVYERLAVVRHAPVVNSGRVEGTLWQLTGEPLTLDGNDTITEDLLAPGSPSVNVYDTGGKFSFAGVIEGQDSAEPSGYAVSLTGNARLRHLVTRTAPTELDLVAPPPAPPGTRNVSLTQAGQSAGDFATLRSLSLSGKAGTVAVPPGTYGAFSASGRAVLVLGAANSSEPSVYNFESLSLSGGSELRLAGPVVLTVRGAVTLSGSTLGAGEDPRRLLLKMSGGDLKITGGGVLHGVVRAPQSAVTVEGNGRLRGTVACDRLAVSGNGVLQITENDLPPPPVNRPPEVEAGGDQTITLPTDTTSLLGTATDDGLPEGTTLTYNWGQVSGPGAVTFDSPGAPATNVKFTQPGDYVLRLTASDSLLTGSDELTVTVVPRNQPPSVEAGGDQVITLPAGATLNGAVTDDGLPRGSVLAVAWSVVEGPGAVIFADPSAAATTATFSAAGRYTLRLAANDTEFTASDDTVVEVLTANLPPVVSAGPDQSITPPNNTIRLNGEATDDGRPSAALGVTWTQVSGPAEVSFGDAASAVTTATFTDQGTYVLRLTATDTELTASDEVEVEVGCPDNLKNLDVVLVIDRSGSMAGSRLANAKTAAKSFVDNLQLALDQVGVVSFSTGGQLNQALTHDGARAKAAIDSLIASGGTNIGSGITAARIELTSARHNPNSAPVMIVLSDGENSAGDFVGPANTAKAAGIRIISIGIAEAPPAQMRSIASSPNDFYFAPDSEDLEWIYAVIAGSVCRNAAPLVRAGDDFELTLPNTAALSGEVHDDGLPANSRLTSTWSVVNGPAPVNLFDASAPVTNAVFSAPGAYVLRLTASDSSLSRSDEVTVTVHPEPSLEGATLTLTPNGPTTNVIGATVTFNARLLNGQGQPIPNFGLSLAVAGPNATSATGLTDANGAAAFGYAGTNTGTDTVRVTAQGSTLAAQSNAIEMAWTVEPPDTEPSPGATPALIPSATQGWIGGPAHQSVVNGVVPITLGPGVTLAQGTVEYCTVGPSLVCTMLNGAAQGGPGATVAAFDTTVVANGSYIIRMRGTNAAGEQLLSQILLTVAGENKPGRMSLSITDMVVPVAGLPITVGRTYDSLDRHRAGDFGFGWNLSVGSPRLEVGPDNTVTITEPGTGRRVSFRLEPRSFPFPMSFMFYPSYTPDSGVNGTLTADGCGIMLRSGGGFTCFFGEPYRPTTYVYTDPYGRAYTMSAGGGLRTVKDLTGNTLTFTPTGITSSSGDLSVPFVRDAQGRIRQITDAAGKVFVYNYDAAGNLASVVLPSIATPVTYQYDAGHLFLRAVDPRGQNEATATYHPDGRLATVSDAAGNLTRYDYDLATNITTTTSPDGGVSASRHDPRGLLLNTTDPLGRMTTYTYDANRNKLSETNALGQTTRYTYDARGNQTSVTDAQGKTTRMTYNKYGGLVTSTDQLGNVRTVLYDANSTPVALSDAVGTFATYSLDRRGSPITYTDGNGGVYRYTYDIYGNRLSRTDSLDRTTTYAYDQMGRLLTTTDPRGNVTRNTYDSLGRLLTITDALNRVTRYEYDGNGNRTAQVDASGRRTTYTYDAANRMTKVTFPNNTSVNYTYDFRGRILTETDQTGHVTTHEYDKAGQLVKTTHPDGSEVRVAYDAIGRVTSVTDERGQVTTYEYDPSCGCSERVAKITDALGHVTAYAFDAAGRRTSLTDANNRQTRYAYDARGRMTRVTYPDGTTVGRTYDGERNKLTTTDEAGNVTRFSYTAANELLSVTDPVGNRTAYAYDATGNLLTITDALNRATRFEYDRLNRLTRRTLPLGMSETLAYDAVGNLASRVDFNGKRTTYTYDTLNRLLTKVPDATLGEPTVRFTYTASGERATMVDASGTTTYTYDRRHRLLSKATPQGTLIYTYDAAGNVRSLRSSNADGVSADYTYDAVNRMETATDNRLNPGGTAYAYDAVGNVTSETQPNGVKTLYSYDDANQLTGLTLEKGGTPVAGYTYTVAPTGRRLSASELGGRTVAYSYDAALRLTGEAVSGDPNGPNNGSVAYTYDAVGNRLERNSTLAAVPSVISTYDANDRLNGDAYDANGNTTQADGVSYTYDFENRIKTVNGGAVSFVYDGDGNRAAKTAGGVTTRYLVDDLDPARAEGYAPIRYQQVVEEISGGAVQRAYTYGNRLVSQRRLSQGAWAASFYGRDGHGSTRLLTDEQGAVTDTFDYDAYGTLVSRTGATPNNYLYSGEQFDADLGFYYQRARYYNQQRGRFMTMDTYEGRPGHPVTLHKYLYANADPVNHIDPSGCMAALEYALVIRRTAPNALILAAMASAIACIFLRAASAVVGGTEPVPGNPCLLTRPPCPPCPTPPPPAIDRVPPSRKHFPCPDDHWHYYEYNQNPFTCQCYGPKRKFGGCCGVGDPNAPC